ncbi:MAG: hypothetical protein J5721_07205 [Lachnospiraceae bacterium]|nr:hypothetical protein [Lachnospiraceae bacterium]
MTKRSWKTCLAVLAASALMAGCAGKEEEISIEESAPVSIETSQATPEPKPEKDWAEHYKDYFRSYNLNDHMLSVAYRERSIAGVIIRLTEGSKGGRSYLRYELEGKEPTGNYLEIYTDEQGMAYYKSQIRDHEPILSKTDALMNELEASIGMDNIIKFTDEDILGATYDREETEDGTVYDVLYARVLHKTSSKANRYIKYYFYVNRVTQDLEKFVIQDAGDETICYVSPIESIEIPEELLNAKKEKKKDEFLYNLGKEIMKHSLEATGVKSDSLDKIK